MGPLEACVWCYSCSSWSGEGPGAVRPPLCRGCPIIAMVRHIVALGSFIFKVCTASRKTNNLRRHLSRLIYLRSWEHGESYQAFVPISILPRMWLLTIIRVYPSRGASNFALVVYIILHISGLDLNISFNLCKFWQFKYEVLTGCCRCDNFCIVHCTSLFLYPFCRLKNNHIYKE